MKPLRAVIEESFHEVLEASGLQLAVPALRDDTVLLASGMDSLGFAILVARLEESLGFDPFIILSEPTYPRTFGEFVRIYEAASDRPPR